MQKDVDRLTASTPNRVVISLRWQIAGRGPAGGDELPSWQERTAHAVALMRHRGYDFERSERVFWFFGRNLHFKYAAIRYLVE